MYRGLAGLFILDDPATDVAALPHTYGVDDFPIIVQDKNFDGDQLDESNPILGDIGILGDTVAVNGTVAPYLDVASSKVRLRLLNASNARVYNFGFADGRSFALVATDGGLLPAPQHTEAVMLAPGERAEVIVDVKPGERVVMRSTPQNLGVGAVGDRFVGGHDTLDLLELRAAGTLSASQAVPAKLVDVPRLDPALATHTREFRLSGTSINGRKMDMNRIDATVVKGSIEIWTVINGDGAPHSFHIHDVQFQVLQVNGAAPPPQLSGWKDTVFLRQGEPMRLIARFSDYSDPGVPYMFHCHVLRHEDQGMMGQFVVVEPGQQPSRIEHHSHR